MCCHHNDSCGMNENQNGCHCQSGAFLSRKKQIESFKQYLRELEEKADDVREFIKELENGV